MRWGAVMTAMSFISVPHWGHLSGSTSKIFRSNQKLRHFENRLEAMKTESQPRSGHA